MGLPSGPSTGGPRGLLRSRSLGARCSVTTSTPDGAARAPSWACRMPSSSPTSTAGASSRWPTSHRTSSGSSPSPAPSPPSATRPSSSSADAPAPSTLGILDADANGVDLRACGLHEQPLQQLIPRLAALVDEMGLEPYDVRARRGELKHLILTLSPAGAVMLRFVLRSRRISALLESRLPIAARPGARGGRRLRQPPARAQGGPRGRHRDRPDRSQDVLPMPVNGLTLNLRPNSFFQTNTAVAAGLYRQAQDWMREISPDAVLDLYCGVGGFAAARAAQADVGRVLGVEVLTRRRAAAPSGRPRAARGAPGRRRVEFRVGDATDVGALDHDRLRSGRAMVVVNPPRRGIGPDLARWLEQSGAAHVIYSSCNVEQPRPRPRAPAVLRDAPGPPLRHVPPDVAPRGHRAARTPMSADSPVARPRPARPDPATLRRVRRRVCRPPALCGPVS